MAPVKKDLGQLGRTYIAEWRDSRGLTQEALAERINMSRTTLSKIENSESPYTQRTLEAIAEALSCKPYDLLIPLVKREERSPETGLKLALLAFGVDRSQVDQAIAVIRALAQMKPDDAQSAQSHSDDQFQPATRRRAPTP